MTDTSPDLSRASDGGGHVMVFTGGSAVRRDLPREGVRYVGVDEAGVAVLSANEMGDCAARIECAAGASQVAPAEGEARALLNERPLVAAHPLRSGDTVRVGGTDFVFDCRGDASAGPRVLSAARFEERLDEEVERSLRYGRPLALVVLTGASVAPPAELRARIVGCLRKVDVIGDLGDGEIGLTLPETGESAMVPVERIMQSVREVEPEVRGAVARCPVDAVDATVLLAATRRIAAAAEEGEVATLAQGVRVLEAGAHRILAVDPRMIRLFDLVRSLARSPMPVLVQGETGAGKELVAAALHAWSPRAEEPFVAVSCAAMSESLLEDELFGHVKGAFTGADEDKPGLFEAASGGTLLLDEIGEASPRVQAELLRVLETGRLRRLGGLEELSVDVRVVAATNRDLEQEGVGAFRRDLFFRLGAATVHVPALRERPLDIPPLAARFLQEACDRLPRERLMLADDAMQRLSLHRWPGNVRELRNSMELVAATANGERVTAAKLPEKIAKDAAPWLARRAAQPESAAQGPTSPPPPDRLPADYTTLADELSAVERLRMKQALLEERGIRNKAARRIGMPLRTFVSKLKKHRLDEIPSARARKE